MSNNILYYKGYCAKIEYSVEDKVMYGKIEGINSLISFESESALEIEGAFHEAVDDYLSYCEEVGIKPEKAYKGSFNVRVSPKLHRTLALNAMRYDLTLNNYVKRLLEHSVQTSSQPNIIINLNKEVCNEYNKKVASKTFSSQPVEIPVFRNKKKNYSELWNNVYAQ